MKALTYSRKYPYRLSLLERAQHSYILSTFRSSLILLKKLFGSDRIEIGHSFETLNQQPDPQQGRYFDQPLACLLGSDYPDQPDQQRNLKRRRPCSSYSSMLMSSSGSIPYKHLRSICVWSLGLFLFLNLCLISVITVMGNPERIVPYYSEMGSAVSQGLRCGFTKEVADPETCE